MLLGCPFSRPAIIRCLIRLRFITGFFWVGGGGGHDFTPNDFFSLHDII